jgi:hypothetical protein
MEAMRERWTDDRLDDLNGKVDAVRGEMSERFDKVSASRGSTTVSKRWITAFFRSTGRWWAFAALPSPR